MVKRIRAIFELWLSFWKWIRVVYERLPDIPKRLSEMQAVLRNANIAPWSKPKRVWSITKQFFFDRPEWLSARAEPLRDIRFRRQRRERSGFRERFHRLLHRMHTLEASAALWAIASVLLIAVSVVVGLVIERQGFPEPETQLASTLVTLTEVVSGAAGILFAVIVFGIQFHGERLGQASYLARYFGRREGLVPIAGFSLAVVTANACVALLSSHGLPHAALPMAYLDYLLAPLVLFLLLFLLHRMVVSVSADIFDRSLVPGLCWEYERAIDEEIHHAGLIKEYEQVLGDVGLRYSCGAGMIDVDPVTPVKFTIPGKWQVTDVKLTGLRDLAAYIHARCPEYEGVVAIGPEDVLDNTVVFVLSARRDDQGRQRRDTQPPPEECRHEIDRMLRRIFRLGRVRERDVVGVLADFERTIVSQARHDRADQLERGLGVLEELIELRLERDDSSQRHPSFRRQRLADNLEGHEYFDMVSNAVESGDREKVAALLMFAGRMMGLALRRENPSLYQRAGQMIVSIYYRATEGKELADYVGEYLDNVVLTSLGSQFEYAHSSWRLDPPKIAAQMPVLIVDLAWRLELMRAALEAGRTTDATHFQDRLFRWDEHSGKRFADPDGEASVPPELREASDLLSYATIITAAWCLHLIEKNHEHADTAKTVFQRCANDLGSREHLLRLWETIRSKSFTGRPLDDPFGVTRWTMASPRRSGVTVGGHVSDAWIERGFMAVMLASSPTPKYEVPEAMHTCPPFAKSTDNVKTLADSILANDAVRKDLLNITDEKRDETVSAVVALFTERFRLFKLDRLTTVVSSPLLDEHRNQLQTEVAKELEDAYGLASTLAKLGGLQHIAHSWFLPRIRYAVWLQKDSVVGCGEHPMDFAPLIATSIQQGENTRIMHAPERIASPTKTIRRLDELAGAVRDAVVRLRATTRNPILVFVPQESRIIEAVIGQQGWRLPCRRDLGDNHIGDWEGCHLFRFPYFDPSSVVIMDALAFYGKIEESVSARLDFDIDNRNKAEHDDALRKAEAETDPTKIAETDTVTVLAVARYSSGIGLHDPKAAFRVAFDLTQIGFALVEGEGVYHRPDCSLLSAVDGKITHTLARSLRSDDEHRTPCKHCKPDEWEERPEQELQDAIAVE